MNITITNDDNQTIYTGKAYTNFALLHGRVGEVKTNQSGTMYFSSLQLSNGKDRDGNWKPSTFADIKSTKPLGNKGDVITVVGKYEVSEWQDKEGNKRKSHSFFVFEVLGRPATTGDEPAMPFDI